MTTSFIGVDLAWKSEHNNSGLAVFHGDRRGARPVAVDIGFSDPQSIVDFILSHRADSTIVAIDAPLIIENSDGQRPCETLISKRFWSAHAGAHTSNLKLYPAGGGVRLARSLQRHGFRHCVPPIDPAIQPGHWFFEVYPHPAQVGLFGLERIIKYKKGSVAVRKQGLEEYRRLIGARILASNDSLLADPSLLEFLSRDLRPLRRADLKHYEDGLDAIFCSFLAFHLWLWGWRRNELVGNLDAGYIVLPSAPLGP
jgi:predicted RNase H-like nuclease